MKTTEEKNTITHKFRVGVMDNHGNKEEFTYFNDELIAYEFFIDKRTTEQEVWMEERVGEFEFETLHSYSNDEL